ncbi:MAG: VWA domain-containing protein, partial [Lachnospiraceae bacterium]|nr:VWA domain-containing protein [Lachnospiraceae bacterium]
ATGGPNSYALGGYRDTPLEEVLTVYMEPKGENEIPSIAIEMVIDQSGSMSDGNGIITNLDLAKESAAAAVDNLRDNEDYVGVIAFDDSYEKLVPLEKVTDKEAVKDSIYSLTPEGGTSIYPAVAAAALDLSKNPAKVKHIILLTDGQDGNTMYDDLIKAINDSGITLSCVSVGDGSNDALLTMLAESCNGRYFHTDLNTDVPRIFAQEIYLSSNTYLVNEEFVPILSSSDQIIRDVVTDGMPTLYGYVATSTKERSIEALRSPFDDPILAYWQYGLGKTVAWTTDATGEWTANYSGWENYQLLWHNILQYVTEDMGMEGAYVTVDQKGSKAVINYSTEEFDAGTKVTATIFDDEGNVKEITLDPSRPGEYSAEFETKSTGVYSINVQQSDNGKVVGSTNTAAIMQYSLEYRFYPNNTLLDDYGSIVGAVFKDNASEVFLNPPEFVKNRYSLTLSLLLLAVILFLCDIAIRRFHVDVWHLLRLDKLQKKINAKAAQIEDYKKNKESIERAKIAKEVVSGVETAGAVGGAAGASAEGGTAPAEGAEDTKTSAKKAKKEEDEAPKATTLFAEMNQKRSFETSQKQAAMQQAYKNGQGFAPQGNPMQQRPMQGGPMQNRPMQQPQQRPQGAPMQNRPMQQPQQRPQGAPMQNRPMQQPQQRPGAAPQGGNSWVNRVNPSNGYMNGQGGNPAGGPGGAPGGGSNQTKTWTRK